MIPQFLGGPPQQYTYPQLLQFAQNAGFTGQSAQTAASIAMAESGGNAGQINYADPGGSYGLMQINQAAHPGTATQALDPQGSFNLAYQISNGGQNFSPWSTYNSGAYQSFLPGSDAASVASDMSPEGYYNGALHVNVYPNGGIGTGGNVVDNGSYVSGSDPGTSMTNLTGTSTAGGSPTSYANPTTDLPTAIYSGANALSGSIGGWFGSLINGAANLFERGGVMFLAIVLALAALFIFGMQVKRAVA